MVDTPPWLSLVSSALPAGLAPRICEVNTNDGTFAAALRRQWPASTFFGLAFHDEDRQERKALVARVTATWGADAVIYFGDKLRTVRAAPPLDDCDVMIVDTHDAATGAPSAAMGAVPGAMEPPASAAAESSFSLQLRAFAATTRHRKKPVARVGHTAMRTALCWDKKSRHSIAWDFMYQVEKLLTPPAY
jgi:hypothetical protein